MVNMPSSCSARLLARSRIRPMCSARVAIKGGWVLAPLDLHLGIERPYGVETQAAVVAAVLVAAEAEGPLQRVQAARALPGRGVEGDRYAVGRGTVSGGGRGYELTLIEAET